VSVETPTVPFATKSGMNVETHNRSASLFQETIHRTEVNGKHGNPNRGLPQKGKFKMHISAGALNPYAFLETEQNLLIRLNNSIMES
jgi:hypothetical protein